MGILYMGILNMGILNMGILNMDILNILKGILNILKGILNILKGILNMSILNIYLLGYSAKSFSECNLTQLMNRRLQREIK